MGVRLSRLRKLTERTSVGTDLRTLWARTHVEEIEKRRLSCPPYIVSHNKRVKSPSLPDNRRIDGNNSASSSMNLLAQPGASKGSAVVIEDEFNDAEPSEVGTYTVDSPLQHFATGLETQSRENIAGLLYHKNQHTGAGFPKAHYNARDIALSQGPPEWCCSSCTFCNNGLLSRCEICDNLRSEKISSAQYSWKVCVW